MIFWSCLGCLMHMQSVVGSGGGPADLGCLSSVFGSWLSRIVLVRTLGLFPSGSAGLYSWRGHGRESGSIQYLLRSRLKTEVPSLLLLPVIQRVKK